MRWKLTVVAALAATAAMLTAVAAAGPVAARQAEVAASASPPLGALPPDAGSPQAFGFDPRRADFVYVLTVSYPHDTTRGHVYKTTHGGQHWHATATTGTGWTGTCSHWPPIRGIRERSMRAPTSPSTRRSTAAAAGSPSIRGSSRVNARSAIPQEERIQIRYARKRCLARRELRALTAATAG